MQFDSRGVVWSVSRKEAAQKAREMKLRGIVHVGHVPNRMQPIQIRQLLSVFGQVTRMFFKPRPLLRKVDNVGKLTEQQREQLRRSRIKQTQFREGWVEFADKRIAKLVAEQLHQTPMGVGKNRHKRFAGELWVLKYLSKVRWEHLSDQMELKRVLRQKRIRSEMSSAKKDIQDLTAALTKRRRHPAPPADDNAHRAGGGDDDEVVLDEADFATQLARHRAEVESLATTTEPSEALLDTVRSAASLKVVDDDLLRLL